MDDTVRRNNVSHVCVVGCFACPQSDSRRETKCNRTDVVAVRSTLVRDILRRERHMLLV